MVCRDLPFKITTRVQGSLSNLDSVRIAESSDSLETLPSDLLAALISLLPTTTESIIHGENYAKDRINAFVLHRLCDKHGVSCTLIVIRQTAWKSEQKGEPRRNRVERTSHRNGRAL